MLDFVQLSKDLYKKDKQIGLSGINQRVEVLKGQMADVDTIHPQFKQQVGDTRYLLEKIKSHLDLEEVSLNKEPLLVRKKMAQKMITLVEDMVIKQLNQLRDTMDQVTDCFNEEQHWHHKNYYQQHLVNLLLECPFTDRAYHKPHGFSGDYQTIKMVVDEDPYQGKTLFGKVLQKWSYVADPWGPSLRGRLKFLVEWLSKRIKLNKEEIHILNLGVGAAIEIQQLIKEGKLGSNIHFHLVDFDPHAIRYCQETLEPLAKAHQSKINWHYYSEDITSFLTRACTHEFPPQDIVYTAGIFDYLNEEQAQLMLQGMYQLLSKNGYLLAGNFRPSSRGKAMLWYTYEWPLVMRLEEDLKNLAGNFTSLSRVDQEETGTCLFLEMQKDKGS